MQLHKGWGVFSYFHIHGLLNFTKTGKKSTDCSTLLKQGRSTNRRRYSHTIEEWRRMAKARGMNTANEAYHFFKYSIGSA